MANKYMDVTAITPIIDQITCLKDQINLLKTRLDTLSNQVATNTADIDLLQKEELGPDTSIIPVKPKQKDDLEIFAQNLQEVFGNIGISAQEAYTALGELTDWIKEDKKWY